MPADIPTLEAVEVEYETMPGWGTDISHIRKWDDLPEAARAYVARCEELVGVPITWIGVGPGRDAVVTKPAKK
jgi:adenylosuccinate synthase